MLSRRVTADLLGQNIILFLQLPNLLQQSLQKKSFHVLNLNFRGLCHLQLLLRLLFGGDG